VVALVAAGCRDAVVAASPSAPELLITESPSPYREVTAGSVRAVLPDGWRPRLAAPTDDPRQGLIAAPRPKLWLGDPAPVEGFAAMWVDGTRVGVPSDYYYLAATGPALGLITGSSDCSATHRVFADHRPEFAAGEPGSPGDYVARGRGTCTVGRHPMRWAYFVAAPGYGPVREIGIPSSGLYVVVAVMRDSPQAPHLLGRLLKSTEFGGASVPELIEAARPIAAPILTAVLASV
jgi:hypothetical protein